MLDRPLALPHDDFNAISVCACFLSKEQLLHTVYSLLATIRGVYHVHAQLILHRDYSTFYDAASQPHSASSSGMPGPSVWNTPRASTECAAYEVHAHLQDVPSNIDSALVLAPGETHEDTRQVTSDVVCTQVSTSDGMQNGSCLEPLSSSSPIKALSEDCHDDSLCQKSVVDY